MSGRDPLSVWDFFRPSSDSLLGRVDFLGIFGRIGKATIVTFWAILTAWVFSIRDSVGEVYQSVVEGITDVTAALTTIPTQVMGAAVAEAVSELTGFNIGAAPAAAAVSLATLLVIVVGINVFFVETDD